MLVARQALARRLDPDQRDVIVKEVGKDPDCVRSAADAGDHRIGQASLQRQNLRPRFLADHALKFAHHQREGMRSGDRAEQIMRVGEARRPVAQRFVDRILQGPRPRRHRHDLGPHQLHPEHVERLPLDIVRAHVDLGLEPEQCPRQRGRDAVLPRPGFGDQLGLAHALGEQSLRQHLVGLVRPAVKQILALQVDLRAARPQVAAQGQRGRSPRIGRQQPRQFGVEGVIVLGIEECRLELLQCGDEDFGDISPAIAPEAAVLPHAKSPRETGRSASNKAFTFPGSFLPGAASTPEPTSSP